MYETWLSEETSRRSTDTQEIWDKNLAVFSVLSKNKTSLKQYILIICIIINGSDFLNESFLPLHKTKYHYKEISDEVF